MLLIVFAGITFNTIAQGEKPSDFNLSVGTDLASTYLWRGSQLSAGPSIQPWAEWSYKGLTLGVWGSYEFTGVSKEVDLYAKYTVKDFSLMYIDLFFPDNTALNQDFFNFNNKTTGHTAELVNRFLEQYRQPEFREIIDNQYLILINQIIGSIVLADFESFETLMARYSRLQLLHFNKMIPIPMIKYFEDGIRTNEFYLKLCGSGGGGYLLAISKERLKAEAYFNLNHLDYTIV